MNAEVGIICVVDPDKARKKNENKSQTLRAQKKAATSVNTTVQYQHTYS